MTARIGNYVGLVPATASLAFPFVGNSALHDGFPFVGNSTCSSDELLLVRNQICTSGEIMSVGNFTRDSDQILQRRDFVENDPSPSQSELALVLHEVTRTRECMNAVFDHLDDLCDRLGAFCENRERDHRVNKDVAISKSTLGIRNQESGNLYLQHNKKQTKKKHNNVDQQKNAIFQSYKQYSHSRTIRKRVRFPINYYRNTNLLIQYPSTCNAVKLTHLSLEPHIKVAKPGHRRPRQ